MSDYSGKDLLNVFSDLKVNLLNLSPNVVKAWFDTDDKDMQNLLNWMCTSLGETNYVSPLENAEFLELETPLVDEKYEKELKNIERDFPGLFDTDSNAIEIEFLEDEIDILLEEENHIEDLIKLNQISQGELSKELAYLTSKEIETALKLKSSQDVCQSLGEQVDDINNKLYVQLTKYGSNLYNFEFSCEPNFISNMDVKDCRENFENISSCFIPLLESEFLPTDSMNLDTQTCLEKINANDSIINSLTTMRSRLFHSHQSYLASKIEVEELKNVLDYLNKTNVTSVMSLSKNAITHSNRDSKEETKKKLCEMLDNISDKLADQQISQTKLKYAQQEQDLYQSKLDRLTNIENMVLKFVCQYILLSMLFIQEKRDIDSSDTFFRKILHYVSKDLQSCAVRTAKMRKIISEYEAYTSKSIGEKHKMIRSIIKILSGDEDYNLSRALEVVSEFKNELNMLESKMFSTDLNDLKNGTRDLKTDINILQSFLVCGPTHRIVIIPYDLNCVLREIDEHFKKQVASVNTTVEISNEIANMKKSSDKWPIYRRQLWIYFYTDPQKLLFVIKEIEEELKKCKLGKDNKQ